MIKHVWFDFSDTLALLDEQEHNRLRYGSYAEIMQKPVTDELKLEYEVLMKKYTSNSGVFTALGQPADYWSKRVNSVDPALLYRLADKNIPEVLQKLKTTVPVSLFTNIQPEKILISIGLNKGLFTHIIEAGMVKEPKPNLEGFYKIIEMTGELPENILYVGDSIGKDIKPAKAVGLKTCLIWGKSPEADYSAEKFEDLLNIVK